LLSTLLPYIPHRFVHYIEPFLGSGAVFFAIANRGSGHSNLSDLNNELINVWLIVRDRPSEFAKALEKYEGLNTEAAYYKVRAARPRGWVQRATRFFYLNQTCTSTGKTGRSKAYISTQRAVFGPTPGRD
jgi:DNA adenine methylase